MNLSIFTTLPLHQACTQFFKEELKISFGAFDSKPFAIVEFFKNTNEPQANKYIQLIEDVYLIGIVNDEAFAQNHDNGLLQSISTVDMVEAVKKEDYQGLLLCAIQLKGQTATRGQLAEITRLVNRQFPLLPVTIVFKYDHYISLANTERSAYKVSHLDGEKIGKVSLLRDVDITKPHSGHLQILSVLKIENTGKKKVDSFAKLYSNWQEVFSVSLLNKKFYQELSNWYFWATKHVVFPGAPTDADAHLKKAKLEDLVQEHRATNVIRMLTRLLFVWFIKEKKLIPEALFELETLKKDILNEIEPFHDTGIFKEANKQSVYYKAILQNLFFATLNCPIESDSVDKRKRGFRGEEKGKHFGIDWMMRYKKFFKNPDSFLEMMNQTVPFLNGGLFECLDDKQNKVIIDGFSDNETIQKQLVVPDYLFFGVEEEEDLSKIVGIDDAKHKKAAVKGLINILKAYKFTITENTPLEEDVALDPELLGKVFENLLASYNPETRTTARKQTGSFYTPREIVDYMVDESLKAYLMRCLYNEPISYTEFGEVQTDMFGNEAKKQLSIIEAIPESSNEEKGKIESQINQLFSYQYSSNPFTDEEKSKQIITALSTCTILDPACGSGAFPMGILQKMVYVLGKLDPENKQWKEVQLAKAQTESAAAFAIEDKQAREQHLIDINDAFDQNINDPDYARKLFLIENCIYGVDIQPIATQISKLRFFISLVVEQKVTINKANFGIRPLPNLETKFVAANTLIGIEKPKAGDMLKIFNSNTTKDLEKELKKVRHNLFSARTKETKLKYRQKDQELRTQIADQLKKDGWINDAADKLAAWDPYNQNTSSPFFDSEWMFDINGFDVVIGNPPYKILTKNNSDSSDLKYYTRRYKSIQDSYSKNLFTLFIEHSFSILSNKSTLSFIIPEGLFKTRSYSGCVEEIERNGFVKSVVTFTDFVFENAVTGNLIFTFSKNQRGETQKYHFSETYELSELQEKDNTLLNKIETNTEPLSQVATLFKGMVVKDRDLVLSENSEGKNNIFLLGKNISKWSINSRFYTNYSELEIIGGTKKLEKHNQIPRILIRRTGATLCCSFLDEKALTESTLYSCWSISKNHSNKFLLALLNSSLLNYYNKELFITNQQGFPQILMTDLELLPIKQAKNELPFITQVDQILSGKKAGQDTSAWENEIDVRVYHLYELTYEEACIIDPQLTKDDFEKWKM